MAKASGAAAMIIYRPNAGEIPPPLRNPYRFFPDPDIPVCATWKVCMKELQLSSVRVLTRRCVCAARVPGRCLRRRCKVDRCW